MNVPKMLAVLMLSAVAPLWATTYVPMQLTVTPTEQILRIELIETNYVIETLEIERHDDLIFGAWSEAARLTDTAPYVSWTNQSPSPPSGFYRVRYTLGTNRFKGPLQAIIDIPLPNPGPDPDPDPGGGGHCETGEEGGDPPTEEPIDLGTVMVSGMLGDHSQSASEAYTLVLITTNDTPHSFTSPLGSTGSFNFLLKRGRTYRLTLAHADSNNIKECDCCDNPETCCYDDGCGGEYCEDCPCECNCNPDDPGDNQDAPDYDYSLAINPAEGMLVDDPQAVIGVYQVGDGGAFHADGKTARLHLPGGELEATDATNPDRTSRTNLVMVVSGASRAASLSLLQGGGFPDGHPTWSGSGVSGTPGSPTATWSGSTDSTVTAQLGASQTETLPIDLVPENRLTVNWRFDEGPFAEILDAITTVVQAVDPDQEPSSISGSVAAEFKRVDYYADGSRHGAFIQLSGSITADLPELALASPPLPIGASGVTFQLMGGFQSTQIAFNPSVNYDQSLQSPGTVSGTLSGSSTGFVSAEVEMGWDFAGVSVQAIGSATLSASGELRYNDNQLRLCGDAGVSDLTASAAGVARFDDNEYEIGAEYVFDYENSQNLNVLVHDFK